MRVPAPKKNGMRHAESKEDLESGPLLDKEQEKHAPLQDVPGRILGLPTQLVAGAFYCCGELSDLRPHGAATWRLVSCLSLSSPSFIQPDYLHSLKHCPRFQLLTPIGY